MVGSLFFAKWVRQIAALSVGEIRDGYTTEITVRLDLAHSLIHNAGIGYILKPVVRFVPGKIFSDVVDVFVPEQVIVRFNTDATIEDIVGVIESVDATIVSSSRTVPRFLLQLPNGSDVPSNEAYLRSRPEVGHAYANLIGTADQSAVPNDALYQEGSLWGLHNDGTFPGSVADIDIDALQAWGITTGTTSVVVAVIDSGVDIEHPDIWPNLWINEEENSGTSLVDDEPNGYTDDIFGYNFADGNGIVDDNVDVPCSVTGQWASGHGTGVAGIIGAVGNNGPALETAAVGVAWTVRLMCLRVLSATGCMDSFRIIEALEYARDNGAHIVNMSLTVGTNDPAREAGLRSDFASAIGQLFVVASAGNLVNPTRPRNIEADGAFWFPQEINHPQLISVAAINEDGSVRADSKYGPNTVDLFAPGNNINTTFRIDHPGNEGQHIQLFGGTSAAAPFVSGTAALMLAQNPALDAATIRTNIMAAIDHDARYVGKVISGGRLNAWLAVVFSAP